MIVLDTLNRAMNGGDENSSTDTGKLINNVGKIVNETGAHVMIIHHSGKEARAGARGHSSIKSAVDTEIKIIKNGNSHTASVDKQRDMSEGDTFNFTLKAVPLCKNKYGKEITSAVVEVSDSSSIANDNDSTSLSKNTKTAYTLLKKLIDEGGKMEKGQKAISIQIFREKFVNNHGCKKDSATKAFTRAQNTLKEKNYCASDGEFIWLCEPKNQKGDEREIV